MICHTIWVLCSMFIYGEGKRITERSNFSWRSFSFWVLNLVSNDLVDSHNICSPILEPVPSGLQEGFPLGALSEVLEVWLDGTWGYLGAWPRHMQGYLGTSVENVHWISKIFYENPVWNGIWTFQWILPKYPVTSILECQGHLGDYLGVQPEPVDAQVEHGEGADGWERDGHRLVPDVGHRHHVHQVADAGYRSSSSTTTSWSPGDQAGDHAPGERHRHDAVHHKDDEDKVPGDNDDDDGNDEKDNVPGPCPDVEEWIRERFQKKKKLPKWVLGEWMGAEPWNLSLMSQWKSISKEDLQEWSWFTRPSRPCTFAPLPAGHLPPSCRWNTPGEHFGNFGGDDYDGYDVVVVDADDGGGGGDDDDDDDGTCKKWRGTGGVCIIFELWLLLVHCTDAPCMSFDISCKCRSIMFWVELNPRHFVRGDIFDKNYVRKVSSFIFPHCRQTIRLYTHWMHQTIKVGTCLK